VRASRYTHVEFNSYMITESVGPSEVGQGSSLEKVNLAQKFDLFKEYWSPKIVGELNESYVKVVKLKGEFVWHHHESEDELFMVVKGQLLIRLLDRDIALHEGKFLIVPKGVEHLPVARDEVQLVLIETKTTVNTGNLRNERTVSDQWI